MKRTAKVAGFGIATAALLFGPGPAGAGQTVTYKGTGSFTAHRELMPLANGGAAVHVTNAIVATIEPSKPGFIDGNCAGLGYLAVDGKYSVDTYCTFAETGEDAFDIRAKVDGAALQPVEARLRAMHSVELTSLGGRPCLIKYPFAELSARSELS